MNTSKAICLGLCGLTACISHVARAQESAPSVPPGDAVFYATRPAGGAAMIRSFDIVRGEGRALGEVVHDAPYSADAVTETVQILPDGNRIVHKNRTRIYRDSAGRMRREQTLDDLGGWYAAGEPVSFVTIDDPVAGISYFLDAATKTARAMKPFKVPPQPASPDTSTTAEEPTNAAAPVVRGGVARAVGVAGVPGGSGGVQVLMTMPDGPLPPPPGVGARVVVRAQGSMAGPGADVRTESLGQEVLQGLTVDGTRQRSTIPAGAIGNEQPIETVTETWSSPELGVLVQQDTTDPRFGETHYRLTNVVREEPAPELFAVPADYKIEQVGDSFTLTTEGAAGGPSRTIVRRELHWAPGQSPTQADPDADNP